MMGHGRAMFIASPRWHGASLGRCSRGEEPGMSGQLHTRFPHSDMHLQKAVLFEMFPEETPVWAPERKPEDGSWKRLQRLNFATLDTGIFR